MLCPDVVNFRTSLKQEETVQSGNVGDHKFESQLKTHLQYLGNIFEIKVVVPSSGPSETPEKVKKILTEDTDFYVVENGFDMSVIFDKTFHHNFVSSGELSLSTINTSLSQIPCKTISISCSSLSISLPGNDVLTHSLTQILSKKSKTKSNTFHFQQNVKLLNLKTSQADKLQSFISQLPTPVAATWCHPDQSICPSSLASYLADKGMQVQVRAIIVDTKTQYSMQIPTMEKDQFCDWEPEHISDVEDWLGGVLLQIAPNIMSAPLPCMPMERLTTMQATGLFTTTTILNMMSTIARSMGSAPWVSVSILGPGNGTVFRGGKCLETSDSVITVILTRQGDWIIRGSRTVDHTNAKPSKYA